MEKSWRQETSFSWMILDQVCHSMDGNNEKFSAESSGSAKKIGQGNASSRSSAAKAKAKADSVVQDEMNGWVEERMEKQAHEKVSSGRNLAMLLQLDDQWVEERMEKQAHDKVSSGRNLAMLLLLDDQCCPPVSSDTASSSSSNWSSAELPSSGREFVPAPESRKSCSSTTAKKHKSIELSMACYTGKKSNTKGEPQNKSNKKMGVLGPLTRFIRKHLKIKKLICFRGNHKDGHVERNPKHNSEQGTFPSPSSSSFINSYQCNGSRPSFNINGAKRRRKVRFHPLSVIVDEHGRPSGHKRIHDQNPDKFGIGPPTPSPRNATKPKTGVAGILDLNKTNDHDQEEKRDSLKMETKRISDKNSNMGKVGGVDGDEEDAACAGNGDHLALVGKIELKKILLCLQCKYFR